MSTRRRASRGQSARRSGRAWQHRRLPSPSSPFPSLSWVREGEGLRVVSGRVYVCKNCLRTFSGSHRLQGFCSEACRFWHKVQKGPADACWPWQASYTKATGYGRFKPSEGSPLRENDDTQYAHRAAFLLARGPIPDGLHVLHSCDNPICCNPAHLRAGTRSDNMNDMHQRGRWHLENPLVGDANPARYKRENMPRGENHGQAKLTWAIVAEVRALHAAGSAVAVLAERFGVTATTIRKVVERKTWVSEEKTT